MSLRQKVMIVGALPESLTNFRGELIKSLSEKSYVIAMASEYNENVVSSLKKWGVSFTAFPVQRNGINPLVDYKTWKTLRRKFKQNQPNIILAYTIKPIIWGGLASKVLPDTRFYALVTGLGYAFQGGGLVRNMLVKLVTFLYRSALQKADMVIFQNPDNMNLFVTKGIIPKEKGVLVNGSGVNTEHFPFLPLPASNPAIFLTIGRLLSEKGFREYYEAAGIVKQKYPEVIFQILGPEDPSPDGISLTEIVKWQESKTIEYLGSSNNVQPYLQNCHIYVLASYHEGMPRTVLEALSTGRPILTTDVPGCRETVTTGRNGYLVPKANATALAERMIWFVENSDQWERMGKCSRDFAEEKYDVHKVNDKLIEIMRILK